MVPLLHYQRAVGSILDKDVRNLQSLKEENSQLSPRRQVSGATLETSDCCQLDYRFELMCLPKPLEKYKYLRRKAGINTVACKNRCTGGQLPC